MALLPRYQRTGIQVRQPRQMDFAAQREQARLGQTIAQQVSRMSDFAFKMGAEQAEQRGQERVREEGAIPTLQQLEAQEGPRTIAERAAYDAANRIAVIEIESTAKQDMQNLIREADKGNMSMTAFEAQMADIRDGYTASLDVVDPVAASVLEARLNDSGLTYTGRYSDIVTKKAQAAWSAKVTNITASAADEVIDAATQAGATRESIQAAGEKLLQTQIDLGVNEAKARTVVEKTIAVALKNNALYRFDNAADVSTKQALLEEIRETGIPGYDYSQIRSFTSGLESNLNAQINQERRNFESELNDAIEVMALTGETKPGFEFNEDELSQIYPEADVNTLRDAWEDAQADATNIGNLANMSPERINEVTEQLYTEIRTSADPAKAGQRYNDWVQRVERRNTAMAKDAALFVVQTNENAASVVENIQTQLSAGNIDIAAQGIVVLNDIVQGQYDLTRTPQGQRKIMPKSMAAGIVEAIQGIDTDVASQYFSQMQEGLGDLAPQFIEELRAAKLRPEYVEAMYQTNPALQKELLDMSGRDIKEIKVGLEATQTTDTLREMNVLTEDYRRAFLAGGGKSAEKIFNEQFAIAEKLAYSRVKDQALSPAEAAESAIADIFSEYENTVLDKNGRYIVPSAFDLTQTQRLAERILDDKALAKLDIVPLDSAQYPGYVDEAVSLASIASDGLWLNNGTADGLVLHYNINGYPLPVLNSSGQAVEVKFDKLSALVDGLFSEEIDVTDPMYGYSEMGRELGQQAIQEQAE